MKMEVIPPSSLILLTKNRKIKMKIKVDPIKENKVRSDFVDGFKEYAAKRSVENAFPKEQPSRDKFNACVIKLLEQINRFYMNDNLFWLTIVVTIDKTTEQAKDFSDYCSCAHAQACIKRSAFLNASPEASAADTNTFVKEVFDKIYREQLDKMKEPAIKEGYKLVASSEVAGRIKSLIPKHQRS